MTDTVLAFVQMGPAGKASKAASCACQLVRVQTTSVLVATLSQVHIRAECSWGKGGEGWGVNLALLVMSMMRCVRGLTWSVKHSFTVLRL